MDGYTVVCSIDPWPGRPFADPLTCRHDPVMALPIGARVEPRGRGGRRELVYDAIVCLDCGTDGTGQADLVEGLTWAMAEMGHVFPFWRRLCELVDHRAADLAGRLVPMWMWAPLGLDKAERDRQWLGARVWRAAEYMGRRMARYAGAA